MLCKTEEYHLNIEMLQLCLWLMPSYQLIKKCKCMYRTTNKLKIHSTGLPTFFFLNYDYVPTKVIWKTLVHSWYDTIMWIVRLEYKEKQLMSCTVTHLLFGPDLHWNIDARLETIRAMLNPTAKQNFIFMKSVKIIFSKRYNSSV